MALEPQLKVRLAKGGSTNGYTWLHVKGDDDRIQMPKFEMPTRHPTKIPTGPTSQPPPAPVATLHLTQAPTSSPTKFPTVEPTQHPTRQPTAPTTQPTAAAGPTGSPTGTPPSSPPTPVPTKFNSWLNGVFANPTPSPTFRGQPSQQQADDDAGVGGKHFRPSQSPTVNAHTWAQGVFHPTKVTNAARHDPDDWGPTYAPTFLGQPRSKAQQQEKLDDDDGT